VRAVFGLAMNVRADSGEDREVGGEEHSKQNVQPNNELCAGACAAKVKVG
jgi:hypothetical protein